MAFATPVLTSAFAVIRTAVRTTRTAAKSGKAYSASASASASTTPSGFGRGRGRGHGHGSVRRFCATPARGLQFHNADRDTFLRAISKKGSEGKVVLVDFYADWCGPCRVISPILEKLTSPAAAAAVDVKTGSGRSLDLVTIDTDVHPELAATYQVSALPTVVAFRDGKPVNKFVGALPEPRVREFIAQL